MKVPFTKMHGIGNDFIVIDGRAGMPGKGDGELGSLSRRLCDRRFGIGADQILILDNSERADFRMRIFNADGSEVEMCGNGIRCFAKYIWDRKLSGKDVLEIETAAGIIKPEKSGALVKVDMGTPVLDGRQIPVDLDGLIQDYPLTIEDKTFNITCVSMGNPHAVIFVDDVDGFDVKRYGPRIESHKLFPRKVNVEFAQVLDPQTVSMRVWERGAGETMACGTGASAVAVAANLKGMVQNKVTIKLLGGDLLIELDEGGHVSMTGPAEEVFEGQIPL
jgi:diaminopimelate epimerase